MTSLAITLLVGLAFGYLLGSIPFGLILTRAAGGPDVRTIGSGNIGATNVLRTGRKGLAAATLLCDMLKGTLAVLVAAHFSGHDTSLAAGLGAFLGHLFPVWLKFKGGKASPLISWRADLGWTVAGRFDVRLTIWLVVALGAICRYSSLARALVASALTPLDLVAILELQARAHAVLYLAKTTASLLWIMHRANIGRLFGRP